MLSSRGNVVLLSARLTGTEREAACEVLARRLGIVPNRVYTDCSIIGAPEDLPDGDYAIEFEGVRVAVTKLRGTWLVFDTNQDDLDSPTLTN